MNYKQFYEAVKNRLQEALDDPTDSDENSWSDIAEDIWCMVECMAG